MLVSYSNDTLDPIKYVSVVDDDTYPERELSLVVPKSVKKKTIVGSSQGLFCFHSYNSDAVIWNPTIRKSVDIVVPNVLDIFPYRIFVGFGVCPRTCDPKLVKIISICSDHESQSKSSIPWQVEVFALSSGVWTSLSTNLPRKSIWFQDKDHVDIDGFIYWRVLDRFNLDDGSPWNSMIMSFDVTGNEFTEIYLPGNLTNHNEIRLLLSKLRESLVVLEYEKKLPPEKRVYGVWMMENGNPKSFTKLYTIDSPNGSYIKALGFSKSGKPIIVMKKYPSKPNSLSVYEPNTKGINDIRILGKYSTCYACSYTETLLLLNH